RIPLLYRGEANDSARRRNMPKKLVRNIALRAIYSKVSCFLAIGEEARRHYIKHGVDDSKIYLSPYVVDTSPFRLDDESRKLLRRRVREQFGITQDDKVVLFSGKLSHRKGVDLLLEAMKRIKKMDVVLLLLGDGDMRDYMECN